MQGSSGTESGNTHTHTRKCVRHSEVFACVCVGGCGDVGNGFCFGFERFLFCFWIVLAAMEEMK